MRRALFLVSLLFIALISTNVVFAAEAPTLRDYDGIELAKGTFIPVINTQEISTAYCDEGSKVKFIATNDLYLYETNVIPRETEFYGYIEKINEPVIGTNASMVIKVTKLRLPDGFEIPIKAYVYTSNNNLFGGELTAPASYDKMPHYQQGLWLGTLQFAPGATRMMGQHTVIASGADLMLILAGPTYITHTVMN